MNSLQKNIALWLIISLVFVLVYHLFSQPKGQEETIVFSDFISYVDKGQITEVTMQGDNITGKMTSGKKFKSYAPNDPSLIPLLKSKGVRITAKPEDNPRGL